MEKNNNSLAFERCVDFLTEMIEKYGNVIQDVSNSNTDKVG